MLSTGVGVVMRSLLLGIALRGGSMFTLGKENDKMLQIEQKMVKRSIWKTAIRYGWWLSKQGSGYATSDSNA